MTIYIMEKDEYGDEFVNDYHTAKLSSLKSGEFFKLKPESKAVMVRGEYDRADKKFFCPQYNY